MEFVAEKQYSLSQHQTADGCSTNDRSSAKYLKRITHNQKLEMFHLYTNTDMSIRAICNKFGISDPVLYHHLDRLGLPYQRRSYKTPRLGVRTHKRILSMRREGRTPTQIAADLGISSTTVYRTLQRHGQPVNPAATNKRPIPPTIALINPPKIELPIQMVEPKLSLLQRIKRWFGV